MLHKSCQTHSNMFHRDGYVGQCVTFSPCELMALAFTASITGILEFPDYSEKMLTRLAKIEHSHLCANEKCLGKLSELMNARGVPDIDARILYCFKLLSTVYET